jgi:very-short-patch-repair endonuclease
MTRATRWETIVGETRGPIESDWLAAFCNLAVECGYRVGRNSLRTERDDLIVIIPQDVAGRYVLDFAIYFRFRGASIQIAVDCDARRRHSERQERAKRDARRDQALWVDGWRLLRFTGLEIIADAKRCATVALNVVMDFQTAHSPAAANVGGFT